VIGRRHNRVKGKQGRRGRPIRDLGRPLGGFLGPASGDAGQSLAALTVSVTTGIVTGLAFAAVTGTLQTFPGLLMFIPAAIAMRGNVFGPLGSRLSTALQAGTFSWSRRVDSLLVQNIVGAVVVSLLASVAVAVVAHLVAGRLGNPATEVIGIADFIVVSTLGGMLASMIVLFITLALAVASVRFGWDLDNVTAPLVSASGDLVTLPSLVLATLLIQRRVVTTVLACVLVIVAVMSLVVLVRSRLRLARRVVLETLPVLVGAGTLSLVAGAVLERSIGRLLTFSVLLVILPGYLSTAGAMGGILANRLSTKIHLGLVEARRLPSGGARDDIRVTFVIAIPIFVLMSVLAGTIGVAAGHGSPGLATLLAVALTGGMVATGFVAAVAYYGTLVVVRFGLDPDNHGIPLVSAFLDVVGAFTLVGAMVIWNVA